MRRQFGAKVVVPLPVRALCSKHVLVMEFVAGQVDILKKVRSPLTARTGGLKTMIHTATHCNTLHCSTLQHTAAHCYTLQHTAAHCSALQHTATRCSTNCSTLHDIALHCTTLQHTATHGNTLQHTTSHCNTLQYTSTCA